MKSILTLIISLLCLSCLAEEYRLVVRVPTHTIVLRTPAGFYRVTNAVDFATFTDGLALPVRDLLTVRPYSRLVIARDMSINVTVPGTKDVDGIDIRMSPTNAIYPIFTSRILTNLDWVKVHGKFSTTTNLWRK